MQDGKKHRLSQLMVNELLDDIDSQFKRYVGFAKREEKSKKQKLCGLI